MLLNDKLEDEQQTNSVEQRDFVCPICDYRYANEKQFYGHLQVHAGDVKWKCRQCPQNNVEFESQSKLKIHENMYHNVARPYSCQECDLTFDRASQLDYHYRSIHLGEKSQLCEICGKSFFRKTDLRTHLNIHFKTNVCICEVCGRKFNHISNLIRHCRMHAGIKPYPCSICGKRFTQISSLARHKRIHERAKESTRENPQNNYASKNAELENHNLGDDQVAKATTSNSPNVMKRQHYCKTCGESFKFIFLLRQHEKTHSQSATSFQCKHCNKEATKFEGHACKKQHFTQTESRNNSNVNKTEESNKNAEPCESKNIGETAVSALETIISATSEQKIDLENVEDRSLDINGTIETREIHSSKLDVLNNCEQVPISDTHILLCKQLDTSKKENIIYIRQLDKNGIAIVPQNEKVITELEENDDEDRLTKHWQEESKSDANETIWKTLDARKLKSENFNIIGTISWTSQKTEFASAFETNEHVKSDSNIPTNQETNSTQSERDLEELNSINNTISQEEPMLRLVQAETGEQFYELIINNLVEKLPNVQYTKIPDNKLDGTLDTTENIDNTCTNAKDADEQIQFAQSLQDVTGVNNELHYAEYGLQGEDRSLFTLRRNESENLFSNGLKTKEHLDSMSGKEMHLMQSVNESSLVNDPQADFDRYVEANFEVFEKLTYENSTERFLEFVEITETGAESSMYKEPSMVCLVQNEGERFFELLQESQTLDKTQDQHSPYTDCNVENRTICDNDDEIFLSFNKDNKQCETNMKGNRTVKKDNKQLRQKQTENSKSPRDRTKSQDPKTSKLIVIKFQCTVCSKSFSTSYNYKQHIGTHFADQQKFHCKECGISFAWKSTLNKHIANNHKPDGPQKFSCEMCPKIYTTLSQVNEHVKRDHLKERNHICLHCGKSFFKKYDLKIHNRIHTDERPYVCRVCGKRFHHRSHIIRHERIHI